MRTLYTAVLAVSLVACGDDDSTGPGTSVVGTYALTRAAGMTMPATVYSDATVTFIMQSGTLVVSAGNTWAGSVAVRTINAGGTTDETLLAAGTWSQTGNTITFTDASDAQNTFVATRSGNTLTAQIDLDLPTGDVTIVFTKQ